ncbi:hypothetical protein QFC19_007964 [Naganishia cerealis]|uniref:Uncharacterized protein n=1 Tax=Naganishia cerealis TaxID=610337 RepID=A0ACC2V5N9_9TREE|nr:hypothetical protein QFC19_007964 [Naganishia cerealis]
MGRKKIVIKRLAEDRNRNVTFLKRKAGLMKKAWELSVLCGAEVSVIVFNSAGKLFEFSSASSVENAIDRYHAYAGPVERRKPEEFVAQQAAGGADNSDDDEDVPAASGSGINNGGAPITASGNMSLRGRDEWKEATVPSYAHLQDPMDDNDRNGEQLHHGSALDPSMGPVDPRLSDRPTFGISAAGASSFPPEHDRSVASFRLSRESEEIMEQQRRAEQYRFLQMQAQMGISGPPYASNGSAGHNSLHANDALSGPPAWMGIGRNRQRSDIPDSALDSGRGGGGEHSTSWAAMRSGTRTPSVTTFPAPAGTQPSLNSLYSQRLDVLAHQQGNTSPTRASMAPHNNGSSGGSESMPYGGSSASRHGLPAENISAGEFASGGGGGSSLHPGGIDFYTSYHLPPAQGVNSDGTLDWQRTAAAAQLQAALQAQQAQLAYLRQQKAQQVHWNELVAASGMDHAVHQLSTRMSSSNQQQQQQQQANHEHGSETRSSLMDHGGSGGRYTPRTDQQISFGNHTAPPTASFAWPTANEPSHNAGTPAAGAESWYNNLQEPSALRTSDIRVPPAPASEEARGPADPRVAAARSNIGNGAQPKREYGASSYEAAAAGSEENNSLPPGDEDEEEGIPALDTQDGKKRQMSGGEEDGQSEANKRSKVA